MIITQDLSYTYHRAKAPAVRELNFEVAKGEIFGFLGPSGSGKSTTQKILVGLIDGASGVVKVLDKHRADWKPDDYERIGVSFETPNHFHKLTALENLRYFAALYSRPTRKSQDLLDMVGLGADGQTPVGQYSKGMRTRLSVARCLLHDPDLLFLDEPTAGLDPTNTQRIKEQIQTERDQGKTVFLTTHDMLLADDLCDRVAFIVDGRIALIDSPRELKLQHGQRAVQIEHRVAGAIERQDFPLDGLATNQDFQSLLRSADIQTIHSREASLADVFIEVTGRTLQ